MNIKLFRNVKVQKKLFSTLLLIFSVPVLSIGVILVLYTHTTLTKHYTEQVTSENIRVRSVLFDLTTNLYNISNNFIRDSKLTELLSSRYSDINDVRKHFDTYKDIDTILEQQTSINEIQIYTNNPTIQSYSHFIYCTSEIKEKNWYKSMASDKNLFWQTDLRTKHGYTYYDLTMYRKVPLPLAKDFAILVITVSDNYLKNRLDNHSIPSMASVNNEPLFYDLNSMSPGHTMPESLQFQEFYNNIYKGIEVNGKKAIAVVSTLQPYRTDDYIYILSYSVQSIPYIFRITMTCFFVVLLALFIPCALLYFYTGYFSARIYLLRQAMHQASQDDYNIINSFKGNDELSETFLDLQIMIQKIEEKEAMVYKTKLREQELINHQQELENKQQQIEFKMLTSQINPHFLYNTLETIRMKAFNEDNFEVAEAAKLLGRFLHYSLENIGTTSTTLDKELYYIQLYLKIQKLRFKDRVNYTIHVEPGLDPEKCYILPFLLQPIVENAMLHGLEKSGNHGLIEIKIYTENDCLCFSVQDNGKGMDEETLETLRQTIRTKDTAKTKSIGLYNINQRVMLCYGSSYGLQIESQLGSGTCVSLHIPHEKKD